MAYVGTAEQQRRFEQATVAFYITEYRRRVQPQRKYIRTELRSATRTAGIHVQHFASHIFNVALPELSVSPQQQREDFVRDGLTVI